MVRVLTFAGLLVGTYVGMKALDSVIVWKAERRQENMENEKLERDAAQLKQELLRKIKEKQAIKQQHEEERSNCGESKFNVKDAKYTKFSGLFRMTQRPKHTPKGVTDSEDAAEPLKMTYQQSSERAHSEAHEAKQKKSPGTESDGKPRAKGQREDSESVRTEANGKLRAKGQSEDSESVRQGGRLVADRHAEECTGEVRGECVKCGENFELTGVPHSPRRSDVYD